MLTLQSLSVTASNFPLQHHSLIKCIHHEIKGNDHKFKMLMIVKQILFFVTIGNLHCRDIDVENINLNVRL